MELTITEIKNFGYTYEVEIIVNNKKEISNAENELLSIIKELNLRRYKKEEFEKQCNDINNTKDLQIDLEKESISFIKNKFKDFFLAFSKIKHI